jgi:hypothetical protein
MRIKIKENIRPTIPFKWFQEKINIGSLKNLDKRFDHLVFFYPEVAGYARIEPQKVFLRVEYKHVSRMAKNVLIPKSVLDKLGAEVGDTIQLLWIDHVMGMQIVKDRSK